MTEEIKQEIQKLKIKRRNAKAVLTRHANALKLLMDGECDMQNVKDKLDKLDESFIKVEEGHNSLIEIIEDDDVFAREEDWLKTCQEEYVYCKKEVQRFMLSVQRTLETNKIETVSGNVSSNTDVVNNESGDHNVENDVDTDVVNNESDDHNVGKDVNAGVVNNDGNDHNIETDAGTDNKVIEVTNTNRKSSVDNGTNSGNIVNEVADIVVPVNNSNSSVNVNKISDLESLKLAFELPKAEVIEFSGDPVEYWTFMQNFEVNVARKLSDDATRLQYLLQMCKGKAKYSIDCCLLMGDAGYEQAKLILKRQFGQPHLVLHALKKELLMRRQVSPNDGESLWKLISSMKKCQITLSQMGYTADLNSTDNLLKVQALLPIYLQNKWAKVAQNIIEDHEPKFLDMIKFLEGEAEINSNMFGRNIPRPNTFKDAKPKIRKNTTHTGYMRSECFACNGNHKLWTCSKFKEMEVDKRLEIVKSKKLCFNCLIPGHSVANCRRQRNCTKCSLKHHELIHFHRYEGKNAVTNMTMGLSSSVYLRIVPVVVRSKGIRVQSLALLDSGSDASLCSENLMRKLGTRGKRVNYSVTTVNGEEDKKGFEISIAVKGINEQEELEMKVLTVDKLPVTADALPRKKDIENWRHLRGLGWSGEILNNEVSLLIGADLPEAFWVKEERRGKPKEPYAVRTPLGWSIMGPGNAGSNKRKQIYLMNIIEPLFDQLQNSWKIENCGLIEEGESMQDKRAKAIMDETVTLTPEGHYQIGLPWKFTDTKLPPNKPLAEIRLSYLKARLEKDERLYKGYMSTMNSYLEMGYAEPVVEEEQKPKNTWYLPHHPVVHPYKPEKVRVVFDCAARWKGVSLNDCLLKGPDFTNNLLGVLMRFREEKVAVVADIQAMFHQVKVSPEDRDALRFLWWPNGELTKQPQEYKMSVHLFGATSSPSCAGYALRRTAEDNANENDLIGRKAVSTVKENFYVDDCLVSVPDESEAIELTERLKILLSKGGFKLTKWLSNHRAVLNNIPPEERATSVPMNLDKLPTERALGVCWEAELDRFTFKVAIKDKPMTRRGILSVTSSVYDPLGFAAPFIFKAKSLLQTICRRGVNWDDDLKDEELKAWQKWIKYIPDLSNVSIPRWLERDNVEKADLHIFSDASEKGLAAVAYLRTVTKADDIRCEFVLGKTRVSPVRPMSIPRLELTAAVLSVTLNSLILKEITFDVDSTTYWTDSTTVLRYIHNEDRRFKTFVANRIAKIHESSTPSQWRYVNTKHNPADEGSRGVETMKNDNLWLKGPEFLMKEPSCWPEIPPVKPEVRDDPEFKKRVLAQRVNTDDGIGSIIQRYSSWTKLIKGIGWLLRFKQVMINRTKGKDKRGYLTVRELTESRVVVLRWAQNKEFPNGTKDKRLAKLNAQIKDGLIVVGGRLDRAVIDESAKNPIVIPSQGHVTQLLINYQHEAVGHGGWGATLTKLRERYWILKGRTTVKGTLRKCVLCKNYQGRPANQVMAALPAERVTPDKPPFSFVGVDYFGPFNVKQGRSLVKRYGCIFTCLSMRAVHLEIAKTLDTDSFINALRRFMCRRGQPEKIFSDNGTNFHGAEKELRETLQSINQRKVEQFLHPKGVEWRFNPPTASHMGGVWERVIKSIRRILNGLLAQQIVCEEVLVTVMTEVESILNSRPLTEISFDPRDDDPLTPNHLLLLRGGPDIPVDVFNKADTFGRRRWRQAQYLASVFWQRWRKEYLPLLQRRQKWTKPKTNLKVDDMLH